MHHSRPTSNPVPTAMKHLLQLVAVAIPLCGFLASLPVAQADEAKPAAKESTPKEPTDDVILEGHSGHGEVFNEGPRQAAYLMDGVGNVHFDVTTKSDEARAFVRQGVGQLHGFWYFESERSFRQAAMIDPDCATAYWGMAMSNRKSTDRAKGFIEKATERKDKVSKREQMLIKAFATYINAKSGSKEEKEKRAKKYVTDLEAILFDFPDDIEVKAFICEFLWSAKREGIDMVSYFAVDALIQQVLDVEPLHPVHHYRIHLWDSHKAEMALESAARCGLAAPAIAHMWHMPGHIYSRLKRYHDAVYQQEASARVDHAHMMKDLVIPDQIHNFAHNNEWCIRNLVHVGRVNDAIDLAKNMISMPRHPKYNHIGKSGSYKYGRQRLQDVLRTYQLHDQLIALADTPYLEKCDNEGEDLKRDRYLASALVAVGDVEKANAIRSELDKAATDEKAKQKKAGDEAEANAKEEKKNDKEVKKARSDAEGKFKSRLKDIDKAIAEIDGRLAAREGDVKKALELFKKADGVPVEEQVALMLQDGQTDEAVKKINAHVRSNRGEVRPLAAQVATLWAADKKDDAKKAFEELRKLSSAVDLEVPAFANLTPIATELGFDANWRMEATVASDTGARPALSSLGPFRWQPVQAANWTLHDVGNNPRSLSDFDGKPVVVIFYLGAGCLHCAEQLQAFAPKTEEFRKAGYEVVAISSDKQTVMKRAYEDLENGFPFPLVSDSDLNIFKAYRCYDDFEKQPLHGTFVIDTQGRIRWQAISYEPFMDPDFVLKEANRLLGQDNWEATTKTERLTVLPK